MEDGFYYQFRSKRRSYILGANYTYDGGNIRGQYQKAPAHIYPYQIELKGVSERLENKPDLIAAADEAADTLSSERFWATYTISDIEANLVLDRTPYHRFDSTNVPPASAEVDELNDNGEVFDCVMKSGMIGIHISSSEDFMLSADGTNDVVQPVAGWWIFIKNEKTVLNHREG
ncbi:hypothetical protein C8R43DRAFT_942696 [Mycena crocata]|nr:hypothetical protein C8R43DRAFT_942696 [Mycena crocata]